MGYHILCSKDKSGKHYILLKDSTYISLGDELWGGYLE